MEDTEQKLDPAMELPPYFRCPISMELMKDPVTISTGVTYERKTIEKWFFSYKKNTCPATMQNIQNFSITPNHTLKRLILAWQLKDSCSCSSAPSPLGPSSKKSEIVALLNAVESSPFKVSSLKKLRSMIQKDDEIVTYFVRLNGVEILIKVIVQILIESSDFESFEACEEAMGVLCKMPLSKSDGTLEQLSKRESMKSMAMMLQRGSTEARLCAIKIFRKMAEADYDWNIVVEDRGVDFFKSLFELVSDEINTKASSRALEFLIQIFRSSKKSRLKAIEAGATCVLIELLPDSNRAKCEKILQIIKQFCKCAEGRLAIEEHGMGVASLSKKILNVSNTATKAGVKIAWLLCKFHPTERVLEEMMVYGCVKKLVTLMHMEGQCSTREKVINIFKLHATHSWMRFPCFPSEFKAFMQLTK